MKKISKITDVMKNDSFLTKSELLEDCIKNIKNYINSYIVQNFITEKELIFYIQDFIFIDRSTSGFNTHQLYLYYYIKDELLRLRFLDDSELEKIFNIRFGHTNKNIKFKIIGKIIYRYYYANLNFRQWLIFYNNDISHKNNRITSIIGDVMSGYINLKIN